MRRYVVEARMPEIQTSLFFEVEASSPADACTQVADYYEAEGWESASTLAAQPAARPRRGLRLLYRQRWEANQAGTPANGSVPLPVVEAVHPAPALEEPPLGEEADRATA